MAGAQHLVRRGVAGVRRGVLRARVSPVSRRVRDERLTYLSLDKLRVLERLAKAVDRDGVPGSVIECGVALGGSAIVLASLLPQRRFDGYDVFGMIPPPGPADPPEVHERYRVIEEGRSSGIRGDAYYGYEDDLLGKVEAAFARHGVPVDGERIRLHEGLFEDTLRPDGPVALAHVDCDWHDPVRLCIERIWPQLPVGGHLVFDDYNDYGGCRRAVDAHVAATAGAELLSTWPNAVVRRSA